MPMQHLIRSQRGGRNDLAGRVRPFQAALEREAWDGEWYRRAWFDDGSPLGSATGLACRIDPISQSWSVISGAADPERAACATAAIERDLMRPPDGVALLFTPPFDRTAHDPGDRKGDPPGIRENGGQYTHAASGCTWRTVCRVSIRHPEDLARFKMMVRFRSASYDILVETPDGVCRGIAAITAGGAAIGERPFALKMQDDGMTHHVLARLG